MLKRYFPIFLSSGKSYMQNTEMLAKYHEKYERTGDGCLKYVTALIRDEEGKVLVGYNKKHGSWQIPSGKVDIGETLESTIERELQEEVGLTAISIKIKGVSRAMFHGMTWEGYFFDVHTQGTLEANEIDTMEEFDRVEIAPSDSWLGFTLKTGKQEVNDPYTIIGEWHMFTELYRMDTIEEYAQSVGKRTTVIPDDIDENSIYVQYWDKELNIITALPKQEFDRLITV